MTEKIQLSREARTGLAQGVKKLSSAVTSTLGPFGRTVVIRKADETLTATKDGVTVAKNIKLKDPIESIGADLLKQASIKTAEQAGDGTTTSTLLASKILEEGLTSVENKTLNVVDFKNGIEKGAEKVFDFLQENALDVTGTEQLTQVATISANGDSTIGKLISQAMDKVGIDGTVTVEESKTGRTYLDVVEGMQFNRGYKSPYFVTNNSNMTAVLNDPVVLITDGKLTQASSILPLLESLSSSNTSLLIIADDIEGELLSTLIVNKSRGVISCVAVKAPEFGDKRKHILEDIATVTGGQVISKEKGMTFKSFDTTWLGKARKVVVDRDQTTIIDAKGDKDQIKQRAQDLKTQIENAISTYDKEALQDRLGRLIGGIAVLHVGGQTEIEMKEKKDRVEDALFATRAALEEGILPGGGIALLRAKSALETLVKDSSLKSGEIQGLRCLDRALEAPFITILANAGIEEKEIIALAKKIQTSKDFWTGYDCREKEIVNTKEKGVIDPVKVTRLALHNATSVAGTILTTEAVIDTTQEKKEPIQNPLLNNLY